MAKACNNRLTHKHSYGAGALLIGCLILVLIGAAAAEAEVGDKIDFDISAQTREQALLMLAEKAEVQIAFSPADREMTENSPALQGSHSLESAMDLLLRDSNLDYYFVADDFVIVSGAEKRPYAVPLAMNASDVGQYSSLLAQLQQSANSSRQRSVGDEQSRAGNAEGGKRGPWEEIVVTATKRNQTITDLPMSITAISSKDIERRSLVSMADYLAVTPGTSIADRGAGRNSIIIRGVAARPESDRNVGVYLGEVPIGGLAMFGNADIKLVDMERIEILRGPQGTLYGSSSMSGTVRTIPEAPKLNQLGGRLDTGYTYTGEAGSGNSKLTGVLNLPVIEDHLAVRAVAYRYDQSGMYENRAANFQETVDLAADFGVPELAQNVDDVGSQEFIGGRLSALWQPNDRFSTTLMYLRQDLEQQGIPEEWSDVGQFQQARLQLVPVDLLDYIHSDGGHEVLLDETQILNAVFEYQFDWGNLVSSSAWTDELSTRNTDVSLLFQAPVTQPQTQDADAFTQEVRITTDFDSPFNLLAGVYYEDIGTDREFTNHYGGDPALNPRSGLEYFTGDASGETTQTAYFGEGTYNLTDDLAVTLGGRWFSYDRVSTTDFSGAIPGDPPPTTIDSSESSESYKWNVAYTPSDNIHIYAQWVEGFRLGFPQSPLVRPDCDMDGDGFIDGSDVPTGVSDVLSDSLENYEIGGKFKMLDDRMALNVAAYRINWDRIPIRKFFQCGAEITLNAGGARSQGAELEGSFLVMDDIRVDFGASYTDPELTTDALDLGEAGDRLPGSPHVNLNVGLQYDFQIAGNSAYIRSDWAYVGGYYNNFEEEGREVGDYHMVGARFGIAMDRLTIDVLGRNLLNEDQYSWIQDIFFGRRAYRLRPRTIGVELGYQF